MKYEHFVCVCVQGYMHKTSENVWKHTVLRLHSKHSVYAQKTRKLHVFDICRQSASENTFLDWNMTIPCVCKDKCTKHTKLSVYAEKPRKSHVFYIVHKSA